MKNLTRLEPEALCMEDHSSKSSRFKANFSNNK